MRQPQPIRRRLFALTLGILVALLVAACAPAAPPTPTPAPPKPAAPAAQPTAAPKPAAPAPTAAPKPAAPAPTAAPKPAAPAPTTAPAAKPAATATAAAKPGAGDKLVFQLPWRASGSYSPFYLTRDKGFFREQGLDVELVEGSGSANAVKIVAAGSAPMGFVDGGVAIQSIAEGLPVKVVAGILQMSAASVIVPKASGITHPKGLEGKKLATAPGSATTVLLAPWLKLNGADVNKIQTVSVASATLLTSMLQGQVDGVVTLYTADAPTLQDKGLDVVPIRYADFGFNVPGAGIVVNTTFMKEKPDVVRRFVAAALKGHAEAKRDPQASVDTILKLATAINVKVEMAALKNTIDLFYTKRTQGKPLGWMAPEDWAEGIAILADNGLTKSKPRVEDVMTNEFIPAQ